jgi:hypothetical protein
MAITDAHISLALEIARESKMEKRLGCVIMRRKRVICASANYPVGTPNDANVFRASMHSEMGAIEKLFKGLGRVQEIHRVLRRKGRSLWREKGAYGCIRFDNRAKMRGERGMCEAMRRVRTLVSRSVSPGR